MRKNKVLKIAAYAIAFLVTVYVCLTYMFAGNFNLIRFGQSAALIFSQSENKSFDREYIESNQTIFVHEPNGVGAVSHDYSLLIKELPQKVVSVSLAFNKEKASVGSIKLNIISGDEQETFNISSTSIKDCSVLIQVGSTTTNELELVSRYDAYGGSSINNEEIVSINSIKINDSHDIAALKRQLLFDLIKSVVISIGIGLIIFFIVKSKSDNKVFKDKFCIEKVFLVTAITAGLIFSLLIPIYQVPDELTHINMMYSELNWDTDIKTQPDIANFADTARITRNYDQKVNLSTYFNMNVKPPLPSEFKIPSFRIIRHLPQAIGFVPAALLKMPLWFCITIAEIFALLVFAFFGYFTIKIMPFKKELMTVIMLLPICLQEFPSFSYDSFLLSVYFLLFAYILYLKFTKEKFTLLDVAIILSLTAIVAITKIPYALVAALIVIIPISKIDFNFGLFKLTGEFISKHKTPFIIATVLIAVFAVAFGIKILPYIPEGNTFIAAVSDIRASTGLIFDTVKLYIDEWIVQMTGNLGWFDTPVALVFTVFVAANLLFINLFDFNNESKESLKKYPFKVMDVLMISVVFIGMTVITILSMYGWTLRAYGIDADSLSVAQTAEYMNVIPTIGGVQGRYFLPVLPLLLVPFYFPKLTKQLQKINHTTYLCGYHMTVFVYIAEVLLKRYWI